MQESNRLRLDGLVDSYLEQRRVLNWSPRTIESYRCHLRVFTRYLAAETGVEAMADVRPALIRRDQAYLYHWADTGGRGWAVRTIACSATNGPRGRWDG
jgi:site-specific recombinase XerD